MVMADMAQLMTDDVGIDLFIREEGVAEEGIGAVLLVGEHHGVAVHLALGRTDDHGNEFPHLEEEKQGGNRDTY